MTEAYSYQASRSMYDSILMTVSLRLKANDQGNLYNEPCEVVYDKSYHFTHFSGWLVEEDL